MSSQLTVRHRAYFRSEILNRLTEEYETTVFKSLIQYHLLKTAKGCRQFSDLTDMPYHVHILNGLYPGLLFLEQYLQSQGMFESTEVEPFLRSLIVGFTFHDLNKLVDSKSLEEALTELVHHAETLNVESFFPEWRDYLPEIEFFALGTENRTSTWAFSRPIREWHFLNDTLRPICHFADTVASIDDFSSVADFYERVCNSRFSQSQRLGDIWQLSYVEVHDNLSALLSQKLLNLSKSIVQGDRGEQILFNLRSGFVYLGEPLTAEEIQTLKNQFRSEESELKPVKMTQIDHQSCKFGFIESTPLNRTILEDVIEEKINDLLKTAKDVNEQGESERRRTALSSLFDAYELPLVLKPIKANSPDVRIYLSEEWTDLEEYHSLLTLFGLQKIKFLSGKVNREWRKEFERWRDEEIPFLEGEFDYPFDRQTIPVVHTKELLSIFGTPNTQYTVAALVSACEAESGERELEEVLTESFEEVISIFNKLTRPQVAEPFDEFVNLYLSGNFQRDINQFVQKERTIPKKAEMCIFCGKPATEEYRSEKSFGVGPLSFNNRTVNTLKSKTNHICPVCASELRMRRSLFIKGKNANSAVYYDFGEYLFNVDTPSLLAILSAVFGIDVEEKETEFILTIDKRTFNYNLYNLNFEKIDDTVKGNFWFIRNILALIRHTGFHVFATSIISPYNQHKEIFVFENCMPFVKQLGWDRIRIDEVEERLQEMNLLYKLGPKRIVSNVLSYAEERRSIFSAFYRLDDKEMDAIRNELINFVQSHREVFSMSIMDKLTDCAVQIEWGFGSGGAESGIIRDSLDILKACFKEKRDRDTTIQQIAGGLYKKHKPERDIPPNTLLAFATTLYDDLFGGEWQQRIPQPGRLKNWINQFAFLYRMKSLEELRKSEIRRAIEVLENDGKEVNGQNIVEQVLKEKPERKRYEYEYRQSFRAHFQ